MHPLIEGIKYRIDPRGQGRDSGNGQQLCSFIPFCHVCCRASECSVHANLCAEARACWLVRSRPEDQCLSGPTLATHTVYWHYQSMAAASLHK